MTQVGRGMVVAGLLLGIGTWSGTAWAAAIDIIETRQENQQQRVEQGVRSGQLTPREAARLEREQTRIQRHEQKALSDGELSRREFQKLTREQNRASRHIARQKHDAQQQPRAKK